MADRDPQLASTFHRPFTEQVAFFRRKLGNLVPTRAWDDMLREAHDDGFMVAGAAKADLLADLAAAVDKAIAEGRGIEEFRRDFKSIVQRHGWTGWTGEGSLKGEAWRVRTILTTNASTSYAAGRLAQLRAAGFPLWVYLHGGSREPRLNHLAMNGLILPSDHPAWAKLFPPSDWGCSCYVVGARSQAGAIRLGGDPAKQLPPNWEAMLGKGWDYAPGASVSDTVAAIARKIGDWDHQIAKAFMAELPAARADQLGDAYRGLPSTADDVRRYAQRVWEGSAEGDADRRPLPPVRTLGLVRSDQVEKIGELTRATQAERDVAGFDFTVDRSSIIHVQKNHADDAAQRREGQRGVTVEDFARLPQILSRPDSITAGKDTGIGEQAILFTKTLGDEVFIAVMVPRGARRRELALKTLYIKVGK